MYVVESNMFNVCCFPCKFFAGENNKGKATLLWGMHPRIEGAELIRGHISTTDQTHLIFEHASDEG